MKRILLPVAICLGLLFSAQANDHNHTHDGDVRFLPKGYVPYQAQYQAELRSTQNWQNFLAKNGIWYVQFNENNGLPHHAFGKPIQVMGAGYQSAAESFLQTVAADLEVDIHDLRFSHITGNQDYQKVYFDQSHQGVPVLFSTNFVKLTPDYKVVSFGLDKPNLDGFSIVPTLSQEAALTAGADGLTGEIESAEFKQLAILPIPSNQEYDKRLVYEVEIKTLNENQIPGVYYTLVDANSGEVLYRRNKVCQAIDADFEATVQNDNPHNAPSVQNLPNMEVEISGTTYNTDANGHLSLPSLSGTQTATVKLQGLYSKVITNGSTPSFTTSLSDGATISFDNDASLQERSAYYHVNIIHDTMKAHFPSFTGLDFALPTNVDLTSGTCNAFWNGSSINFYAQGGGCYSLSQARDVVYHEYGHGINDLYYAANGSPGGLQNGAMHEGYADIWGLIITEYPVLAEGYQTTDPNSFIRRYDINPKVYPADLVGQVHADGEIIAGAWWDLGEDYFQDLQQMADLWTDTYPFTPDAANGNEGQLYTDVLIEALNMDDVPSNGGDNDITNGTPNDIDIVTAFDDHGISLLSNANLTHTPILAASVNNSITIDASVTVTYAWALNDVKMFYRVNNGGFMPIAMNNTSGSNYTASIPGQPKGTVVGYYLALEDNNGNLAQVTPFSANISDPNLPNYILVGCAPVIVEDFDGNGGIWTFGASDDNATTGLWIEDIPVGSFDANGIPVQTDAQHTPGGIACALTGNAGSPNDAVGTNDVDGGKTTVFTPTYNLESVADPVIAYYRWYVNNPPSGANPNADWWQVEITGDGGNTWIRIEDTKTSDRTWRRNAFRVKDYTTSSTVQMRFIASDSLRPGQNLDGGSLVEAAVDDMTIYEARNNASLEENGFDQLSLYPNPAKNFVHLEFIAENAEPVQIEVFNMQGQLVKTFQLDQRAGYRHHELDLRNLAAGIYQVKIISNTKESTRAISLQ